MATYEVVQALQAIDRQMAIVALGGAVAGVLSFVYLWESMRLSVQHQTLSAPLGALLWFLPHDVSFILLYDQWFNVHPHWWCQAWWSTIVVRVVVVAFLLYQAIRVGRDEMMPHASQKTFTLTILGATICAGIVWFVLKASLDDELFFTSFLLTAVWPIPFTTTQLLRRKSRKGVSVLQQAVMVPMYLGLWGALCVVDPLFRSIDFQVLTGVAMSLALLNVYLTWRAMPYLVPARDDEFPASSLRMSLQ